MHATGPGEAPAGPATALGTAATGTLAFLFTDIAGSTRLWERLPDAMVAALEQHDAIVRGAIETAAGEVVKTTGDGLMAVFPTVADGVRASVAAQIALAVAPWGETGQLKVRMAIHAGEAEQRSGDYFGPTINRTARLMASGHGGQILLSAVAAALALDRLPADVTLRDLGEYRLRDLGRPERVFQVVHPDLQPSFPPLTTLDHAVASLPIQAAPFVGRRVELEAVRQRLEDPAIRLLTLTGPGGTGKTSLAVRASGELAGRFRDGVAFIDLSAARDRDAVSVAIGRAVGVGEAPAKSLRQQLADRLRGLQMLIVLDNVEQVTAAAAGVTTDLLEDGPGVTLLVTSREPLRVRAEHVYPVPPLGLPPTTRRQVAAAELDAFESIQLFVERARAVRPDFALTDDNAAAVVEICRRLDGLPLAIELAAARLRLFSPEALRDRLGSRLDLLRSASRDRPERQQTLRATIEWSYQLLDGAEQRLFEILSVFSDADVPAIEAVVGEIATAAIDGSKSGAGGIDVVDALASLLERNLVRQADQPHGEPRVRMLETIREYAAERLAGRPDGALVQRAHAAWYADLAARLRRDLTGVARDTAMATMTIEVENLRTAWRFWVGERDLGQLSKLADSLLILNEARGWYRDTVGLTTDLLAVLDGTSSSPELAGKEIALRLTLARARMATQGLTSEVTDAYERTLELFEGEGEGAASRQHVSILRALASLYLLRAEFDKARALGDRILAMAEDRDRVEVLVDGHLLVGSTMIFTGQLREGLAHLDEAIESFAGYPVRAGGSRMGNDPRVACLTTAAFSLWLTGRPDAAVARADAAIELARQLGHPYTSAYAIFHSGLLHHWRREPAIVLDRATRLLEFADEYDFRIWSAIGSCLLGVAQVGLGQDDGLAGIREGMAAYRELVLPPVFWPPLLCLDAGASLAVGRPADGLASVAEAIGLVGGVDSSAILLPEMALLRGDLLAAAGPDAAVAAADAVAAWESALAIARRGDVRMTELRALTRLASSAGARRAASMEPLRAVLAAFTEGFETADLREARDALGPSAGMA